jgi:protein-disulfide isomerase
MTTGADGSSLRHARVVKIACMLGASSLVAFRILVELGFGPSGGLRIHGVPLEYVCLVWFITLWALQSDRSRLSRPAQLRGTLYEWWLSILAVAGTIWLISDLAASRTLGSASFVYWFACGCAFSVFLSASAVQRDGDIGVARGVFSDIVRVSGRPTTWACVIAALSVLAAAPRSSSMPTGGRTFVRWYARQARISMPVSWQVRPVTLVELIDYQCPVCRTAAGRYGEVIADAYAEYGDSFGFVRVDFPLENECNASRESGPTGGLHLAACEAAAAVRLARGQSGQLERQVVEWLWQHQSRLTRDTVFDGIQRQFGLDIRGRYDGLLPAIRRQAAEGRRLGVVGTPTFYLNGRRLPLLEAETMRLAIAIEIGRTGHGRTVTQP